MDFTAADVNSLEKRVTLTDVIALNAIRHRRVYSGVDNQVRTF